MGRPAHHIIAARCATLDRIRPCQLASGFEYRVQQGRLFAMVQVVSEFYENRMRKRRAAAGWRAMPRAILD